MIVELEEHRLDEAGFRAARVEARGDGGGAIEAHAIESHVRLAVGHARRGGAPRLRLVVIVHLREETLATGAKHVRVSVGLEVLARVRVHRGVARRDRSERHERRDTPA